MTVRELMEKLQGVDPDLRVGVLDEGPYYNWTEATDVDVKETVVSPMSFGEQPQTREVVVTIG